VTKPNCIERTNIGLQVQIGLVGLSSELVLHSVPRIMALVSALMITHTLACAGYSHQPKLNFFSKFHYIWRIKFTNETCKEIIVSIFLTMKATILDTHIKSFAWSFLNHSFLTQFKSSRLFHVLERQFLRKLDDSSWVWSVGAKLHFNLDEQTSSRNFSFTLF